MIKKSTVKKWSTVWDDKKALSLSTTKNQDKRVVSKSSCQISVNQHKHKVASHANHTVHRETKNVPVSLHNRFQALANMQNDDTCVQHVKTSLCVSSNCRI